MDIELWLIVVILVTAAIGGSLMAITIYRQNKEYDKLNGR